MAPGSSAKQCLQGPWHWIISSAISPCDAAKSPTCCGAISYAWGAEVGGCTISIAGNIISVTWNLHDVLCILRDNLGARSHIWVDALCINQQDLAERSQQ
ncbi:MAG: hypothetical protein EOP84_13605, partial [Verrucomicrobiaceae bacterium]